MSEPKLTGEPEWSEPHPILCKEATEYLIMELCKTERQRALVSLLTAGFALHSTAHDVVELSTSVRRAHQPKYVSDGLDALAGTMQATASIVRKSVKIMCKEKELRWASEAISKAIARHNEIVDAQER